MTRPACKNEKVRLSLQLTVRARERLERLQELTDADSLSEVIRKALIAYDLLLDEQQKGSCIIVRNEDGDTRWKVL